MVFAGKKGRLHSLSLGTLYRLRRRQMKPLLSARTTALGGFTLVEIMMAIVAVALIVTIALPSYQAYITKARNARAVADIAVIEMRIERYRTRNYTLPPNLDVFGDSIPLDPWGNAYRYLNIENGGPGVIGASRKDRNMVPINSDYDLYSMGADGKTATPLQSGPARDDIVRARNGGFLGLARDF